METTTLPPPEETDFEEIPNPEVLPPEEQSEPELLCESELGKILVSLSEALDDQVEKSVRELMIRVWKKHENYWRDRHYIIWDEFSSDYRTPEEIAALDPSLDIDPAAYAKIVNIYKAHGEAIIAALTSGLPHVSFLPDDADSQDDIFTAKSYTKLSHLIQKRNKGQLLLIRTVFLLYNFGIAFAYNENKQSSEYGEHKKAVYEDRPIIHRQNICPNCGFILGSEEIEPTPEGSELPETVQPPNGLPPVMETECPQCGMLVEPDFEDYDDVVPRLTGYSSEPKTSECIEIHSPLSVRVPLWVKDLKQTPKLALESEEFIGLLRSIYPELKEKMTPSSDMERFERYGRNNSDYRGDTPMNLGTFRREWIQPFSYHQLDNEEHIKILEEKFPNGVYLAFVNDLLAEAVPDRMEDHWTATRQPLANHLHADPLSQPLVPVQDIENELVNLTLETIEFGIPETFYESDAIEAEQYKKSEARPGMLYPAKSKPTMGLDASFHTVKASTLSQEVDRFADRINQAGQFVSGAFPTIWGGALEGGGGTAKEYEQSRSMALQRLNLTWILVKEFWAEVMSKSVRSFAKNMLGDERFAEKKGTSFVNVWIRKAEMNGKVGSVEAEINEAFPVSWAQQRDILLNLIALKNPLVDAVISHPENASIVSSRIGFPELYIPGDDARNKQLYEISQLILAEPMLMDPMMMGGPEMSGPENQMAPQEPKLISTVPVQKWENHLVESETCLAWLQSEVGLELKEMNAGAYMNVVAHMEEHSGFLQQAAAAEMERQDGEEGQSGVSDGGESSSGGGGD